MTSLQRAQEQILHHFMEKSRKAWSEGEISSVLDAKREEWNLAKRVTPNRFINFLIDEVQLFTKRRLEYRLPHVVYLRSDANVFDVANAYTTGLFFSHYTAAVLHNLTTQDPKNIYISKELAPDHWAEKEPIPQLNIDRAFSKPARITKNCIEFNDRVIHLLSSRYTEGQGLNDIIINEGQFRYTSLERTLIDCAVRPGYSGGVAEVLSFYREAAPRLSVNKLVALLSKMNLSYPYHQNIGWYLSQCNDLSEKSIERLRRLKFAKKFYLVHAMKEVVFDKAWQIYYPKGLV